MEFEDLDERDNIEEHWIEINGREKINKEIDYDEIVVDSASSQTRDKVVRWFAEHEDAYVTGYLYVDTETSEVDEFEIKNLHHKGEMTREEIMEFISAFSGMYNLQVVERNPDSGEVHFKIHFD